MVECQWDGGKSSPTSCDKHATQKVEYHGETIWVCDQHAEILRKRQ